MAPSRPPRPPTRTGLRLQSPAEASGLLLWPVVLVVVVDLGSTPIEMEHVDDCLPEVIYHIQTEVVDVFSPFFATDTQFFINFMEISLSTF